MATTKTQTQSTQTEWIDEMTYQAGVHIEKGKQRSHTLRGERSKTKATEKWADKQEVKAQRQEVQLETEKIANKVLAERQQELAHSINVANSELEEDKQKFLEETEVAIAQYQSKIDLLESEIDQLRSLLAQYEAPALPEGSSFEIILVRRCMELLLNKRVVCEFKGVGIDPDGYVVTRLKPQDGGQKAIEKWANYLHIEMELAEAPKFATLRGAGEASPLRCNSANGA
jgi:hypothetical protein